ncbi:unnamed protein product [Schistosoma margrebowiei]|uniref:Uncharacterized protein n=1 Tax=Schistosoma margrebowiei TaxID=48269 RepID=A0A183LG68_9TREM|nr:unnamed protein product [Schistosoma margrebowiei]
MKTSTSKGKHGRERKSGMQLDDLDFVDDLALLSHTYKQMQITTTSVAEAFSSVGLNINKGRARSSNTIQH